MKLPTFGSERIKYEDEPPMPAIDIVATKAPEGMVVHVEDPVIFDTSEEYAMVVQKRALGLLDGMKYMRGDEVGLEWSTPQGKKLAKSDEWAKSSYIPVTPANGDEPENRSGQLMSRSAVHAEKDKVEWNSQMGFDSERIDKWLADFEKMCDYVDRVKQQLYR